MVVIPAVSQEQCSSYRDLSASLSQDRISKPIAQQPQIHLIVMSRIHISLDSIRYFANL